MQTRNLRVVPPSATPGSSGGADRLKPAAMQAARYAQGTLRPGADPRFNGEISLFDPRAAGFQDPLLVTASGSSGSKLKIERTA